MTPEMQAQLLELFDEACEASYEARHYKHTDYGTKYTKRFNQLRLDFPARVMGIVKPLTNKSE